MKDFMFCNRCGHEEPVRFETKRVWRKINDKRVVYTKLTIYCERCRHSLKKPWIDEINEYTRSAEYNKLIKGRG